MKSIIRLTCIFILVSFLAACSSTNTIQADPTHDIIGTGVKRDCDDSKQGRTKKCL